MANSGFYFRLARTNLVRNKRMYGPFCVASALMSGIFLIILNLVFNRSIANLSYGGTVQAMFTMGAIVMTLFTVGYMLYINSFLVKRRKKEFGLYGVLGMERRHVRRVILWENTILTTVSLALGMVGGSVFGRLVFLLLMEMLDTAQGSTFYISAPALGITLGIFLVIFFLTTLYNLNQVRLASPIDLIKGEQKGEKKVRFVVPMTVLGVAMLGFAYYLAITTKNPATALLMFWPAVILVILATWFLFTGGSVFILNALKRSKRIYYKPRNFITISGLSHRMKQNAAGLANICILSTMVMVTVSCCCALYLGQDVIVRQQNPNDISFTLRLDNMEMERQVLEETRADAYRLAEQYGVEIEEVLEYPMYQQNVLYVDGELVYSIDDGGISYGADLPDDAYRTMSIVLLEDFNAVTGLAETLDAGEVLLVTHKPFEAIREIKADAAPLAIKARYTGTRFTENKNRAYTSTVFVIVPDSRTADMLAHSVDPRVQTADMTTMLAVNVAGNQQAAYDFSVQYRNNFRERCAWIGGQSEENVSISYSTRNIFESRYDGYSLYGGLLFLGVFFALLFLINTVLIIYFKQISEGFEDSERFAILQKVGLSDEEVRSTINRQMLIVFLLPLVAALVHIAAASNMIRQMLGTFMLTDFALTMACIAVTVAVFVVVYLIVYRLTARTYYRLVKR